jgi:sRNA-binding regulator protein Hfq
MTKRMVRESSATAAVERMMPTAVMDEVIPSTPAVENRTQNSAQPPVPSRRPRAASSTATSKRFSATHVDDAVANRQAELFYLQKQIQLQTQMIFVMEDGARVQGVVEWYDRHSIKVRGKARVLIYKAAIKYLYKAGEMGSAPSE